MEENISQIIIPVLIVLFVIWLIYRFEFRMKPMVNNAVYDNFPFFKQAVANFQKKIDYLNNRIEFLEARITKIENKLG